MASSKRAGLSDFPTVLGELAVMVVEQAKRLPRSQFDLQVDAFKVATGYFSALNRAPDGDEGSGILDIRQQLVTPTPEMRAEEETELADGGLENEPQGEEDGRAEGA